MTITINGTTGIAGVDGSAGTPAVQGSDTNTGVFYPAADTVAIATNGTEQMRVDSSGNVGVGTTSPSYKLHVAGSGDVYGQIATSNGGAYFNLDVQAATPDYKTIWGTVAGVRKWGIGNYGTSASDVIAFYTGGATERARIDNSGNFSITQSPGKYTVDVTGGATSVANNGTVDFAYASGMLVVNNHTSGAITLYLCGSGSTTAVSSVGTQVGTFTHVSGIAGYRWTNTYGSTATFGFFFVRTRTTA